MARFALELDWKKALKYFVEAHIPYSGLIDGGRVMEFIGKYSGGRRIEDLDIPYAAVATDLAKGTEVVLDSGPATEAIRASIAIPGLFTPVRLKRRFLVDGGLVNPVPVNVARRLGADVVIAVDVTHFDPLTPDQVVGPGPLHKAGIAWREKAARSFLAPVVKAVENWERERHPKLLNVMGLAMRIMESNIAMMRLAQEPPDFLIRPKLGNVFFMDFHRSPEIVKRGYEAGKAAAPEILRQLEATKP
jgi:NTE family protein